MTVEYGSREQQAERANLRARASFDRAAVLLEEAIRASARHVDNLRLTTARLATGLVEIEREVLEVAEETGSRAAAKYPKLPRREPLKAEIPWCGCSLFASPHVHPKRELPDEVAP